MSTCTHSPSSLKKPPSMSQLLSEYPPGTFPLNHDLERNIPRCRQCDLTSANKGVIAAESESQVKAIRENLANAEKQGSKSEVEALKKSLSDAVKKRDNQAEDAMIEYWGIWGKDKKE